ncbi:MAG: AAC(3) family N-acetyltransferase [Lachnospiraceae bacterium]|nr:AAC(3) family N-acetyltransferase [Lachnospiraceae bacterium]
MNEIGAAFEASHAVSRAKLGSTELKLMSQRELVDFAMQWIEKNRRNFNFFEIKSKK